MIKLLIFHSALAPYRVDFFNMLSENYDCMIVFLSRNNRNQNFDQAKLLSECKFKYTFSDKKIVIANRDVNFGYLHYIRMYKPDIIIGGEYGLPTIIPLFWRWLLRKKYTIYSICDDSVKIAKECGGIRKVFRSFLLPKIDGLIFTSQTIADWYKENLDFSRSLVFPIIKKDCHYKNILENAWNKTRQLIDKYNLAESRVFLFVGRLTKVKNLLFLVSVFKRLNSTDTKLVLVGDGDMRKEISDLINKESLNTKIILAGRYEGEALYAWYNIADLFILPSVYEPFGAVTAEALQAGCPVACSKNAGSAVFIKQEENGFVFNPEDSDELLSIMKQYASMPIRMNKEEVRNSVLGYTFDDCVKKFIEKLK